MIIIIVCLVSNFVFLKGQNTDSLRTVEVEEIVVRSSRSLRDIGVQKNVLSETVLRDNLSASMAEVLAQNSNIFIKSSGRATLSTASLRGTAPSHTSVTWNGMELASPMLGMVDFSMIPSYFVDSSEVFHGASSVNVTGGGLGGAVVLGTNNSNTQGVGIQYIQSVASFSTHDEYLSLNYGEGRISASTRLLHSSSENDFPYVNYDKVGHPLEYNRSCGYEDFHALQEFYFRGSRGGRWSLKGWYTNSSRGIPKLTVDYRNDETTKAWQDENLVRVVGEWKRSISGLRLSASAGYNFSDLHYIYQFSNGTELPQRGVDATSKTHHAFAMGAAELSVGNNLMLAANLKGNFYSVDSKDVAPLVPTGFDAMRKELTTFLSARFKPVEWVGLAANVMSEWRDGKRSPFIPALFLDVDLVPSLGMVLSASVAKNYHAPTLNDLYYVPGGNPNLRAEEGRTFDVGLESKIERKKYGLSAKLTLFRSDIADWILWTPTIKGFWTPDNLAKVRSEGVEARAAADYELSDNVSVGVNVMAAYTSSTNAVEDSDNFGNQLPYIPLYSASGGVDVVAGSWTINYKWHYYSERFTTYSVTSFAGGSVDAYGVSDVSLSRAVEVKNKVRFKVRLEACNLFNTDYQSVLSRPMPPRNYAISLECSFGK